MDGRYVLQASASILFLSGLFVFSLGATGRFLPHDEQFLGMTAPDLCARHGCRIVHFMIHDRVSFGGALVGVGLLYYWLAASPLRLGQAWAWWVLALTGAVGFASFLSFLAYGYLDAWHGIATLVLLACFLLGLGRSRGLVSRPGSLSCLLCPSVHWSLRSPAGLGRGCLLAVAAGLFVAGLAILAVGTTCVFVPQDLTFMGLSVEEMQDLNPRLVPLIAHDRAGFGGAICCGGAALFFSVWCGTPSPSFWRILALVGAAGFGAAIGVHAAVGYTDAVHLAPAVAAAIVYLIGIMLTYRAMSATSPEGKLQ
jgi:hypothetical protein